MAILPTRLVEIEFDAGVWTDVSADIVTVATRRGRNRELGAYETGTVTVTLRNESRKYDPEYAAGAYYGKLRPNRRIRFSGVISGVTFPVIVGYIDRITQNYDGPNGAVTTIAASDLFKILNRVELPRSVYTVEVNTDAPELWYRLDEPTGSTAAINSGSLGRSYDGVIAGTGLGQSGLIVRDDGTAGFADGAANDLAAQIPNDYQLTDARPFAIEGWVNVTTPTSLMNLYFQPGLGTSGESIRFTIDNSGKPLFVIYNTAGTPYAVESTSALATGTHHLVARHDSDRTMHVFVDGVDVTIADVGVPGVTTGTIAKTTGTSNLPQWSGGAGLGSGTVDELAIYTAATGAALSSTRIAAHNNAGRTPWRGDTVATRFPKILALANLTGLSYTTGTAPTTLQDTSLGGTVLAYLEKLEETELGYIFVTKDDKVRLIGRQEAEIGAYLTAGAILTDSPPAGFEVPYLDGSPIYDVDEADIIDRATVSREGSLAVSYSDAAAIAEFQIIDATYDGLLHDDDVYSYNYAAWIVNSRKAPGTRVGAVTVALSIDPILNAALKMLSLELADRVTLRRRPKTGAAISYDYRVDAIAHSTGGGYWNVSLQLSPISLTGGADWILELAGRSELDQTTRLGF